ncbi:hypothetical protein HQ520_10095 [bacterium]|nr:hypothetical protein [bacterium]
MLFRFVVVPVLMLLGIGLAHSARPAVKQSELPSPGDSSKEAIAIRKQFVLDSIVRSGRAEARLLNPEKVYETPPDGKWSIGSACLYLRQDPDNIQALRTLESAVRYRGGDDMFGKVRAAQVFCKLRPILPEDIVEGFRKEMTSYEGYLDYGTENHIFMRRMAGLIFANEFPKATFATDMTSAELEEHCLDYMRRYGKAVFASSVYEFLSQVYAPIHIEVWGDAWECSKNEEAKTIARAMLEWHYANAALNLAHGYINGPIVRSSHGLEMFGGNRLSPLLWIYGADLGKRFDPEAGDFGATWDNFLYVPLCDYVPDPVTRNIISGKVARPYSIRQSIANYTWLWPSMQNTVVTHTRDDEYALEKSLLRSVYIHDSYALGGGNLREQLEAYTVLPSIVPFTASWKSEHPFNFLVACHPYWFTGKKWSDKERTWKFGPDDSAGMYEPGSPVGDEDIFGFSPFFQMVHHENAAVLFYNIPDIDPYKTYVQKGGYASPRLIDLIQECFIYVPETVDRRVRNVNGFFLADADAYIAILPFHPEAGWKPTYRPGFDRIGIPGALTGVAMEMGDKAEFGSFEQFIEKVGAGRLDLSRLEDEKTVSYRTTRGDALSIMHTGLAKQWLPEASINGEDLDWENWPVLESPYVSCENGILSVTDGRDGFIVDWSGETPVFMEKPPAGRKQ